MDFDAKVNELSAELAVLDKKLGLSNPGMTGVAMIVGIVAPFVIFGMLWLTGFGFVRGDDGEKDRKKVLKWSVVGSVVVWIGLFVFMWFYGRRMRETGGG